MAKKKFNVGDIVEYIGGENNACAVGATARVTGYEKWEKKSLVRLEWIRNDLDNGQFNGGYLPLHYKLKVAKKIDSIFGSAEFPEGFGTFVTKDSGERQEFASGMVRDVQTGKPQYDLLYMPMLKRWAELMGRGAEKYGRDNWKKAEGQEELDRFKASALRHMIQWVCDEQDEDHAAAVMFNISGAEYVRSRMND